MTTLIKVISPILLDDKWYHRTDEVLVTDEQALELERKGLVDIVSVDGEAVVWPSCCTSEDCSH